MDGEFRNQSGLTEFQANLLNDFQRDFPLCPQPYKVLAEQLGVEEKIVLDHLQKLEEQKFISRIGAVVTPHKAGWSTLAAMSVPEEDLEEIAETVSACPGVNHNYERSHDINLWFVVTGPDRFAVETILDEIEATTGIDVLNLPLVEAYQLDLGFPIQWN
ncbi:MAG: Lrp/AsnC family transcriptional regulator [Rhodospirillaceae bacterium]|jgi:siroheme decarboxylase|nr:Lrp/AsnC family transcriptional regulator [Rhodospirillaceae bacterium]MBT4589005.1 Lrp/AsnC family transcriptional regulator [Rhodospirillaceae bacterium]MBT4939087.1 Lrp/AsnC family transcriptional regulator [Rhodospirillaceae bacterium]MBT5940847.1 Lrp/AsnC family transcriptional regulator [Rhodospirillaceae bacterium]MBT7266689.1 Lrp/AsnC family transcriptional regulator [Rhodospirillaceae bacterium]